MDKTTKKIPEIQPNRQQISIQDFLTQQRTNFILSLESGKEGALEVFKALVNLIDNQDKALIAEVAKRVEAEKKIEELSKHKKK